MEDLELDLANLTQLRRQCIDSLYLCADNVTKYLDKNKDDELKKLKKCLENYILLEAQQEIDTTALNNITDTVDSSNIDQIHQIFLQSKGDPRVNTDRDTRMIEFEKRIQRKSRVTENLDESAVALTGSDDNYPLDSITKKRIQEPVKNTGCGHVYDREYILNYIERKEGVKCPVFGCVNQEPLRTENLVIDEEYRCRMSTSHSKGESDTDFSQEY